MTEYWKSQEKAFCDICKCWLTDNKSSIDFHKNGKRHKENVEKRLRDIQRKSKANEKRDKKFEHEMQRIEQAAAAACKKDGECSADLSTQIKTSQLQVGLESGKNRSDADAEKDNDIYNIGEPKILHRKEKKTNEVALPSSTAESSSSLGSWKAVTAPTYEDLELPQGNYSKQVYEPKVPEKRKLEFREKTVGSLAPSAPPSSISNSWMKVETPTVAFKKRKSSNSNRRQRDSDD